MCFDPPKFRRRGGGAYPLPIPFPQVFFLWHGFFNFHHFPPALRVENPENLL